MSNVMMNKYYVSIENKTTNDIVIYVFDTLLNEQQLQQQLHNIYNDNYNICVERYNLTYKIMINDIMKLQNICVAHNVQCYNL